MNEQLNKLIEQSKLSPPFTKDDVGYIYDSNMVVVAQTRGWGHFQYLPNAEKLQDDFAQFIVDAMNEKIASRPNCGKEQRLFLDEVEKRGYVTQGEDLKPDAIRIPEEEAWGSTEINQLSFPGIDLQKVIKGE